MEKQTLGKFITVLRKANGMTQQQLADMVCVSNKTVSKWEREESCPDISLIPILAEIFKISCDELLQGRIIGKEQSEGAAYSGKSLRLAQTLADKSARSFKSFAAINAIIPIIGKILLLILYSADYFFVGLIIDIILLAAAVILQIANVNIGLNKLSAVGSEFVQIENANKRIIYNLSFLQFSVCFISAMIYLPIVLGL